MRIAAFFLTMLIGLMTGGCEAPVPAPAGRSPFHSVAVHDGAIIATLTTSPAWLVWEGTSEPRPSKPGEAFTMNPGSVIQLSERHVSYQVTAQITPEAGLAVEETFDARSFGDDITKRKFFIAAK